MTNDEIMVALEQNDKEIIGFIVFYGKKLDEAKTARAFIQRSFSKEITDDYLFYVQDGKINPINELKNELLVRIKKHVRTKDSLLEKLKENNAVLCGEHPYQYMELGE